jgi:hypothetical protein
MSKLIRLLSAGLFCGFLAACGGGGSSGGGVTNNGTLTNPAAYTLPAGVSTVPPTGNQN